MKSTGPPGKSWSMPTCTGEGKREDEGEKTIGGIDGVGGRGQDNE